MNKKGFVFIFVSVLLICGIQTFSEAANKIYWTDAKTGKIQQANLDGTNIEDIEDLVLGLAWPTYITLDVAGKKIYWVDPPRGKIQRADLDGNNVEDVATGLEWPTGIAIDVVSRKIYWADSPPNANPLRGKIQRADLDGNNVNVEDVDVATRSAVITGIALDVVSRKIYWADSLLVPNSRTGKIQRADLDGNNVEEIATGLAFPTDIVLDVVGKKIYWVDSLLVPNSRTGKIQRADLDGNNVNVEEIATGLEQPTGIAIDVVGKKVYWVDSPPNANPLRGKIQRADLDGNNVNVEDIATIPSFLQDIVLGPSSQVRPPVEKQPDLALEGPSASKTTLSPGESFTLSVSVVNRGTADAPSTTLRYYRSINKVLSVYQ